MRIGVVADTHGLLRPEALRRLRGVDRIVHAGDIGSPEVLRALAAVAPVTAVRGNNDRGAWALALPETAVLVAGEARLYVLHDVKTLAVDPRAAAIDAVIAGRSHKPALADRDGVPFMNPGSIGPRRFTLPVAMGLLTVRGSSVRGEIVYLDPGLGSGRGNAVLLASGVLDVIFAGCFLYIVWLQRPGQPAVG